MKKIFTIILTVIFIFFIYKVFFISSKNKIEKKEIKKDVINKNEARKASSKTKVDLASLKRLEENLEKEEQKLKKVINTNPSILKLNNPKKENTRSNKFNSPEISKVKIPSKFNVEKKEIKESEVKITQKTVKKIKKKNDKVLKEIVPKKVYSLNKDVSDLEKEEKKLAKILKSNRRLKKDNEILKAFKEKSNQKIPNKLIVTNLDKPNKSVDKGLIILEKKLLKEEEILLAKLANGDLEEVKESNSSIVNTKPYVEFSTEGEEINLVTKRKEEVQVVKNISSKKPKKNYKKKIRNEFRDPDFRYSLNDDEDLKEESIEKDLKKVFVTSSKAALRAGPGLEHSRIRVLFKNTDLVVLKTLNNWSKVLDNKGIESWISNQDISLYTK